MCGIAGFLARSGFSQNREKNAITKMRDCLLHRGPDNAGLWLDPSAGIAMGHRRLSIVDLSSAGHQPMASASGRFVLIFNGEIYNHLDLRKRLTPSFSSWRGHSDTETLLAAIQFWGLEKALKATVGMFALALWDREERILSLARDRIGEKPLYYGWQKDVLLFGSELKALQNHPSFENEIDSEVLPLYFRHGYVPAPYSIWKGIRKLKPGTWISFSNQDHKKLPEPTVYWSLSDAALEGQLNPFNGSEEDSINELEQLLKKAIACQRIADVPLGAFLSGGIDSSTVGALMQAQSSQPINTFTIGFSEPGYNEAEYAKAVAQHLGTNHTELYVASHLAQEVIPKLPQIYDEPFGDSSGIPAYLISKLARGHVTVALTGDGGDELFGGYSRYAGFGHWQLGLANVPAGWRKLLSAGLRYFPALGNTRNERRISILGNVLGAKNPANLYQALNEHWLTTDNVLQNSKEAPYWLTDGALRIALKDPLNHALLADMMTYLPDDILVKVDRAAMSVSLETRVPLLDHRIIEWSLRLPQNLKSHGSHQKWVLRRLLRRHLPQDLVERPKMGFGVPVGTWLRGPLRGWAEELLEPQTMQKDGWLNPEPIQRKWKEHLSGKHNWEYHLWFVLMFQAWIRNQNN